LALKRTPPSSAIDRWMASPTFDLEALEGLLTVMYYR
jgi:hypothetical protein